MQSLYATTNLEGSIDKALFRRFDDFIEFPRPGKDEIVQLLKISFSALKLSKKINLDTFAEKMEGMSNAMVVKIVHDASKRSVISASKDISIEDLTWTIEENLALNT